LKLVDAVKPTTEAINEIKRAYNRLLKREQEAGRYLDDISIPIQEREKRIPVYKIEILDPLEAYLKILKDWAVDVTDDEILNGFKGGVEVG